MKPLVPSISMSALVLALASAPAMAATTVSSDTTTALSTASAGDVEVTEDGAITVGSGSAITVNSNATVLMDGAIKTGDDNGASGIEVASGTTSSVTVDEDGTIYALEDFVADDPDGDNIVASPIASASSRYGIHVAGDASGTIENDGTIYVEGLNSGGIVLDGTYTGSIVNTGAITVIGDGSAGISTQGIDGDLTVEGTVKVVGAGTSAVRVNGDVTGTVTIQGTVSQGYTYTNDDGTTINLSRSALRTGTAAVSITGNVDGGIYIAAPPVDTDSSNDDEDGDGVTDSEEGTGAITAYGNSPALQIGGASDITIGAVTGNMGAYSLAVDGTISSYAYYSNTDAYGVVIGGAGGNVTLTDGIGVSGSITATTYDSAATALLINEGSVVSQLDNSGSIVAAITSSGEGSTTAIRDLSGTLVTINNSGFITASGSTTDETVAIDLSAAKSAVTINQYLNDADAETSAEYLDDNDVTVDPTVYTKITGDIVLGAYDDTLKASSGEIDGDTYFGAGNDTLALSGDLNYTGNVYFGTGTATATMAGTSTFDGTMDFAGETGTLTLADSAAWTGKFANAENLTVTVNGGTLTAGDNDTVSFGTLHVASGGTLGINIDSSGSSTFSVADATLEDGASISATISDITSAEGTFTVLTSDKLTVEGTLATSADLPFIYNGSVSSDADSISITIARKTTDELGLTRAQASAWDAVYATAANDDSLAESLLEVDDAATLRSQVSGLLPDHAGGVFDAVTLADRLVAAHASDDNARFGDYSMGAWLEPVFWRSSRDGGNTSGYRINGWGLSGGLAWQTTIGEVGVSYAWLNSAVKNSGGVSTLKVGQHDFGAFWNTHSGPFMAWARVGVSKISVKSSRTYTGTIDDTDFTYGADGKWSGWMGSAQGGASWRYEVSRRFSLKPKLELSQVYLHEGGYAETADSDAIALTVAKRNSSMFSATPSLSAAYSVGMLSKNWQPLTFQLEAGRRNVIAGHRGDTTAYFNGGDSYDAGDPFTIAADALKGAWIAEASMLAGGYDFTWKISARTEQSPDSTSYSLRASLAFAF